MTARNVSWPPRGPATPRIVSAADRNHARLSSALFAAAGILLLLHVARWMQVAARLLTYGYEWSTMDGYFVSYGQRLLAGLPIYSEHATPPMGFEYVPGYLLALAPLNALFGPDVRVERALAVVLAIAIAALAGHIVRLRTSSFIWGGVAVGLCLALPLISQWYFVRGIDLLVLFVGFSAVALLAESKHCNVLIVSAAAVLFVIGFYCKQTAVYPWGAGVVIVLVRNPRLTPVFVLLSVGLGLAGGLCLQAWSGGMFWNNAFATTAENPYSIRQLLFFVVEYLPWVIPLFGASALACLMHPLQVLRNPWGVFFLVTAASMPLAAKLGAAVIYFLPVHIAAIVFTCQLLPAWINTRVTLQPVVIVAALALSQTILWFGPSYNTPDERAEEYARSVLEVIETRPGRVLTERADSFATMAGREVEWEAVQLPILANLHEMPLDALIADLEAQEYAVVLYTGQFFYGIYDLRRAILDHYEPLKGFESVPISLFFGEEPYLVMVPKEPTVLTP